MKEEIHKRCMQNECACLDPPATLQLWHRRFLPLPLGGTDRGCPLMAGGDLHLSALHTDPSVTVASQPADVPARKPVPEGGIGGGAFITSR